MNLDNYLLLEQLTERFGTPGIICQDCAQWHFIQNPNYDTLHLDLVKNKIWTLSTDFRWQQHQQIPSYDP